MGKKKKSKTVSKSLHTPTYGNKPTVSYSKSKSTTKGDKTKTKSVFKSVEEKNGQFIKYVSRKKNGKGKPRTKNISAKRAAGIARRLKKKY
mgnify:FL=1